MSETIDVKRDGHITQVFLNRPDAFDAFNLDMAERFTNHLISLAVDDSTRGIVVSGTGKAF